MRLREHGTTSPANQQKLACVQGKSQHILGSLPDIRKAIHFTNAIKLLNTVIRTAIKKHKVFSTDDWYRVQ